MTLITSDGRLTREAPSRVNNVLAMTPITSDGRLTRDAPFPGQQRSGNDTHY